MAAHEHIHESQSETYHRRTFPHARATAHEHGTWLAIHKLPAQTIHQLYSLSLTPFEGRDHQARAAGRLAKAWS